MNRICKDNNYPAQDINPIIIEHPGWSQIQENPKLKKTSATLSGSRVSIDLTYTGATDHPFLAYLFQENDHSKLVLFDQNWKDTKKTLSQKKLNITLPKKNISTLRIYEFIHPDILQFHSVIKVSDSTVKSG